jgi:cytochrome c
MKKMLLLICLAPFFFSSGILIQNETETPDENRFRVTVLSEGLNDPTDMAILPDGKVIITELYGGVKLYNPQSKKLKKINQVRVAHDPESGLMTIAPDPDFEKNKWVYVVYSPASAKVNYVSRLS